MQVSEQTAFDWWIIKQLRSMVLTDLRELIADDYFAGEAEAFRFNEGIANAAHYSSEMRWGSLAGKLGQKLFYHSTVIMTARQTSAAEVLINLGLLAATEAAQGASHQLSLAAKAKGVSDGNAGPVAEQLRTANIPTLVNNVRAALTQYLRYLTFFESEPFLPLLDVRTHHQEGGLLSDDAVRYFEQLCARNFADAWVSLDRRLTEFLRTEAAHGRNVGGAGFAARVSKLYEDDLLKRTQTILVNLKQVHQDFGSPLVSGIDEQLKTLGAELMEQQLHGLEGAYKRHLGRLGMTEIPPSGLDIKYSLQRAAIANEISQYIWIFRKVPMKSPDQPAGQPTFIIHGNVGAIQTAPNAVAHVRQQVGERDFSVLVDALMQLRNAVSAADGIDANQKEKLITDIAASDAEIKRGVKDETALLKWLAGIGSIVQTLGSAQPAWEVLRAAGRSVGLPL